MKFVLKKLGMLVATLPLLTTLEVQAQNKLDELKERLDRMEAERAEEMKTINVPEWFKSNTFGAQLQFEAVGGEDYTTGDSYSDFEVATVALIFGATINDNVDANMSFLYEEDAADFGVEEAFITFSGSNDSLLSLKLGQFYLPFGSFATALVQDPLTLELGQTLQTAALLDYQQDAFSSSVYVFDGDIDNPDKVETWGLSFDYSTELFNLGIDYISSIADTDIFAEDIVDPALLDSGAGGVSLSGSITQGSMTVIVEYLGATDSLEYDTKEYEPESTQIELDYMLPISGKDVVWAAAYQTTDEMVGFLPETRISLGASAEIFDATLLSAELWFDEDYDTADGGSGEDGTSLVVQIQVEF